MSIRCVRITLDLDEDVLLAVKETARRENRSAGKVLSELAREALTGRHRTPSDTRTSRHGFQPLPSRGGTVSNALIDRLREEDTE